LQQINPAIKIIIITGYPLERASTELPESEDVGWLQKPVNLEQLSAVVGGMLPMSGQPAS
jgi:two-component SAPR family response regulator